MPRAALPNGIEIEYETIGDSTQPALVLISGLGAQLITWYDDFCRQLADRGFFVIRFDNRDVGLSSKIEDGSSYLLSDMADDLAALLTSIGVGAAHIVGASMGGMIAQTFAIRHADRTRSLTSIMSNTGEPGVGQARPDAVARLGVVPGPSREERIASSVETMRIIWGDTPEFPFDEHLAQQRAERSHDRMYYPAGTARQMVAIQSSGDRTDDLRRLRVPTLVIHGDNDPLVTIGGGEATAAAIPGAELLVIKGMGHAVSRPAWPTIIDAIDKLAARA